MNARCETDLETLQKALGEPIFEKEPGPDWKAPGPGKAVPPWKANRRGDSRLAMDRPSIGSVRRIEPDFFILTSRLLQRLLDR
jgi:hypothetical protein